MQDNVRAAQVVGFWRKIEIFSPQGIPRITQRNTEDAEDFVVDVAAGELAPWQEGHPLTSRPSPARRAWQFTVYGGLYELSAVRDQLVKMFGDDGKYQESRSSGETALFAFTLDSDGYLVENSAVLSACAWAIGRAASPGPKTPRPLESFEFEEAEFSKGLNRLVPPSPRRTGTGARAASVIAAGEDKVGEAVAKQAKGAAKEAAAAGAKATGVAVTTVAATAVGSLAGPVAGGIAGAVAGTFVTKLLSPKQDDQAKSTANGSAAETSTIDSAESEIPTSAKATPWIPRFRLTARSLHEFVDDLAEALEVAGSLNPTGIRVKAKLAWVTDSEPRDEQAFLNSFIANDLAKIETEVRDGKAGAGLTSYLADNRCIPVGRRVDVRKNLDEIIRRVAPLRAPASRWPTDVERPLVLSQQFAVNEIIGQLGKSAGVFAVNGPPGTGKTTMLRDVLAAVVTNRAHRLAKLSNPLDAFVGEAESVAVDARYSPRVRPLWPELTGFEVVVATAGNETAKNVTAEIPNVTAVGGAADQAIAVDYFTKLASEVLGAPCWGLLAAPLGNMQYRGIFANRFWWAEKPGKDKKKQSSAVNGAKSAPADDQNRQDQQPVSMLGILQRARLEERTPQDWPAAKEEFHKAHAEVARLARERQQVAETIDSYDQHAALVRASAAEVTRFAANCRHWQETITTEKREFATAADKYAELDADYDKHLQRSPGFWVIVFTLGKELKQWRAGKQELAARRWTAKSYRDQFGPRIAQCETNLTNDAAQWQYHDRARREAQTKLDAAQARIDAARARWPGAVPFRPDFPDEEQLQLCAPWADTEFTAARNRAFLAALSLHREFILHTAAQMQANLAVVVSVISDKISTSPAPAQLLAAWQSLFLVMPMVSTTFASLPRLFAGLGKEAFGWLFIDEAGQATPQQAVGGIWRARRSVIVGDPQQLEPIVTLPSSAQRALLRDQRVDEQWLPDITSAQRVSDRLALFGTALPEQDGDAEMWVGAPLRVHRRCDRPMFDISNNIAYGGTLMLYGTKFDGPYPGENEWIDIRSQQSDGNWVPAEGEALVRLLSELRIHGVALADIRVISPFRKVVYGVKGILRHRVNGRFNSFGDNNVGTVHTVQGKESPVIILVLGSAPNNHRAREWAAEKPNLLNVAVSRAKRRLYVIGNREKWREQRYFAQLVATVPTRQADHAPSRADDSGRPATSR
jgi:hypothetical protein